MLKAQCLEKIHIHNRRPRSDYRIDHTGLDHIDVNLHTSARTRAAGQSQHNRTFVIVYHHIENICRPGGVSCSE